MLVCKNCQQEFEGKFCPQCGQKVITNRFNLKDSLIWLIHSVFNLDHGFLYTTRELLLQPGHVIRSVLNGITVNYTHPFRILFIWATISTLLVILLGTYDEQTTEMYKTLDFSESQLELQNKINTILKKYLNFIILANVPIVSIISLLFYRKQKLNFTEHMVINSYGYSLTTSLGIILIFIQYFLHAPSIMIWINLLVNVLIMGYVYCKTFKERYILSFFKYLFAFLLSYVLMMLLSIVFFIIIALIAKGMGIDILPKPSK